MLDFVTKTITAPNTAGWQ